MTIVVTILAIAVALLAVLVMGLLRSHAAILRKLHELGAGDLPAGSSSLPLVASDVVAPTDQPAGREVPDLSGEAPDGSAVGVAVADVGTDTVVAFLSSSCATCEGFWEEFRAGVELPAGTRLVIAAKGPEHESPADLAARAPVDVPLIMSSEAWEDYGVPGSPYVVLVDGASGRVRGEGTGGSWEQVARLLAQATGDLQFVDPSAQRSPKPRSDAARERDTDRALLAAGIRPDDPSLYQRFDEVEQAR